MAGVASLVTLSVDDEPRSEDGNKSGVPAEVAVSTEIERGVEAGD
jgi:hypothetical protein